MAKPTKKGGKVVVKAKAKAKVSKGGGGRPIGKTTGLSVNEFWRKTFGKNERLPRSQKMTDAAISKLVHKEFPGRDTALWEPENINKIRAMYNAGNPKAGGGVGQPRSHRYDENGVSISRAPRAAGKGKGKAKPAKVKPAKRGVTVAKPKAKAGKAKPVVIVRRRAA
jgi:hypothetical protein